MLGAHQHPLHLNNTTAGLTHSWLNTQHKFLCLSAVTALAAWKKIRKLKDYFVSSSRSLLFTQHSQCSAVHADGWTGMAHGNIWELQIGSRHIFMIAGLISFSRYRFERLFYLLSTMCPGHWFLHWGIRKCSLTSLWAFIIDNSLCERQLIDLLTEQLLPHLYHMCPDRTTVTVWPQSCFEALRICKENKNPTKNKQTKKSRNAWILFNRSFIYYINWPRNTCFKYEIPAVQRIIKRT